MKILNKYITRELLLTLFFTISVFTAVLLLGRMMKQLSDMLVNQQLGLKGVGLFFLLVTPYMLSFSLPMAMLAATLLVFGRMSADNEITAMRASGISLAQIAAPVVLVAASAALVCLFINTYLSPYARMEFKKQVLQLGAERPMALLEEGTYIKNFPGVVLYIGKKNGQVVEDVTVYTLAANGNVISSMRAQKGIVTAIQEAGKLRFDLYNVRGDLRDPSDPTNVQKIRAGTSAQRYPFELDISRAIKRTSTTKRIGDMVVTELYQEILELKQKGIYPSEMLVEIHQRFASAAACLTFTLIAIPLGIKTSRRETSIGMAMSLGLAFCYYGVTIIANSLKNSPHLYPEAILWLPNLFVSVFGLWLLTRIGKA